MERRGVWGVRPGAWRFSNWEKRWVQAFFYALLRLRVLGGDFLGCVFSAGSRERDAIAGGDECAGHGWASAEKAHPKKSPPKTLSRLFQFQQAAFLGGAEEVGDVALGAVFLTFKQSGDQL